MLTPPTAVVEEIHKLHNDGALLWLIAITEHSLYLARSLSDITWNGYTWEKSWFEIDGLDEDGNDHAPDLFLHLNNIGGLVEQQIIENDNYAKAWVDIYLVNANLLSLSDPIYHARLQVQKISCSRKVVSVKVGLNNPLLMLFPSWKFHGSICQYPVFPGDTRCGYSGELTTCGRTLADCIVRGRTENFGAQLGLLGEVTDDEA